MLPCSDVWAWEKYYKQPEVLSRIDVELLPTEPPAVISQDIEANHVTSTDSQLLDQPLPEPQNGAPIDELEDQPGIFERKDLLTKVEYFWRNGHKDILHRL